ncbi:uncharacterized protein B0H18DRAFT_1026374 [Fomitopsis serialis]|uniref:uncharacterized protein n=1 Tax=Fomitopsis serialis TaxID=139415 RepID=UPI002008AA1A|nr:uncharacterized protein B0H18DRAFT_1026374 [Neoantrodia serialis]KAH9919823.1 hypothetical protein B0H18DRAFT_1026374 [Neoantrodia serialis]
MYATISQVPQSSTSPVLAPSMEPLHLHAPKPSSQPNDLRRALMAWKYDSAESSRTLDHTVHVPEATTSYTAEPLLHAAPHSDARSRLDEWTGAALMIQIKMLRSKLTYFRTLLDYATLDAEQRAALQEVAMDLRTTVDALSAKNIGRDVQDITDMSISSSGSGSFSEDAMYLPPNYSLEAALLSGGAPLLDGGHIPQYYGSPESTQGTLYDQTAMQAFSAGDVGTSYTYTMPQGQVSSSVGGVLSNSGVSSYVPQGTEWYPDYRDPRWTNAPHDDSSSECNTVATPALAGPSAALPIYDDGANTMSISSDSNGAAPFALVHPSAQTPECGAVPSTPPHSWSSDMSECSIAV